MRRRRPRAMSAILTAGWVLVVAALTGCAPPHAVTWSVDVLYSDLEPGVCLAQSYDEDDLPQTDEFDTDAAYFSTVDCAEPHRGQVVGIVEIPASVQWDDFGTKSGPSADEADDWLEATCAAYAALVENHLRASGSDETLLVSPNYGVFGDSILGSCIAHPPPSESGPVPVSRFDVDIESMLAAAEGGFDAAPLGIAGDWFADPLEGPVSTYWKSLDPFTCVQTYGNADQEYYDAIACSLPHEAQFLGWVRMPDDWTGYRADEAAAVVAARCEELRVAIAADPDAGIPDIVVESSSVDATYVVRGRDLAHCWARRPDLSDLGPDLRAVFAPPAAGDGAEPVEE